MEKIMQAVFALAAIAMFFLFLQLGNAVCKQISFGFGC